MEIIERSKLFQLMCLLDTKFLDSNEEVVFVIDNGILRLASLLPEDKVTAENSIIAFSPKLRNKMYRELCDYLRDCGEEDAGKYIDMLQFQMWVDRHEPFSEYERMRKERESAYEELEKLKERIGYAKRFVITILECLVGFVIGYGIYALQNIILK